MVLAPKCCRAHYKPMKPLRRSRSLPWQGDYLCPYLWELHERGPDLWTWWYHCRANLSKALTFIIYMRVVAFACSHSHTAAPCISEPPVCRDKTHTHCIWHLRLYQTFARCLESHQLWQFIPKPILLSSLCITIHEFKEHMWTGKCFPHPVVMLNV